MIKVFPLKSVIFWFPWNTQKSYEVYFSNKFFKTNYRKFNFMIHLYKIFLMKILFCKF